MAKLDVKALGIAFGIVWGGAILILGLVNMVSSWGASWVTLMSSLYIGYKPTVLGSIIGGIWGFFDAGIGGLVVGWLYNKCVK